MADGTIKAVEDVVVGDRLMGPDGTPRNVLSTATGREALYRVVPVKGDPYIVNASHLLSLKVTPGASGMYLADGSRIAEGEELVAVRADVMARSNATARHCLKGWRADAIEAFDREPEELTIPPYLLGAWLGDGSQRHASITKGDCAMTRAWRQYAAAVGHRIRETPGRGCSTLHITDGHGGFNIVLLRLQMLGLTERKFIPAEYKYASLEHRRELLAGLIDSDGSIGHKGCDWISVSEELARDFAFLCRSVGLSCYLSKQQKGIKSIGFKGWYWRASVSGDLSQLPMLDKQSAARIQKKRHLVHGIKLEPIGEGDYYGFEIDGDRLFLLGDFTVTHNTVIGSFLLNEAEKKCSKAIFVVDRVSLCDQTSAALDKYGIPHGVIQAGHWRFRPEERIQVATAQTLEKRGIDPDVKLLIIDEAHCVREFIAEYIKANPKIRVVGLTATPFAKGLATLYTNLVNVTTTNKLIADGWLCPLKAYIATAPDMAGAKVVAGEWTAAEAGKRGTKIIGDIVAEWQDKTVKHFGGPVKTIVFSAIVDHCEELCLQFQAAGHNFQQISYKDSDDDRRRALIDEFRKPDSNIVGLVSCEALAKGFDVPDILCGIAARPYRKSLSGHIQMLGRAMRSYPGKEYALWLDHCGNYARFAKDVEDIFENGVQSLDDAELDAKVRPDPTEEERDEIRCSGCGFVLMPSQKVCPACGHERVRKAVLETLPGVMLEVGKTSPKLPDYLQSKAHVWSQLCTLAMQRKGNDPELAKKFAKAQYRNIYDSWPNFTFETDHRTPVSEPVKSYVVSRLIKWAKSQARKAA